MKEWISNKKDFLIIAVLTLIAWAAVIVCCVVVSTYSFVFYVNDGLIFSEPETVETVYDIDFNEGEIFYILNYDGSKKINKIIQKNDFKKITNKSLEEVKEILNRYRDDLCEKELGLFDKNVEISELVKVGYYYLYLEDEEDDDDYTICILFPKEKKIYYFTINH